MDQENVKKNRQLNSLCDFEEYHIPDADDFNPKTHIDLKVIVLIASLLFGAVKLVWNQQQEQQKKKEFYNQINTMMFEKSAQPSATPPTPSE